MKLQLILACSWQTFMKAISSNSIKHTWSALIGEELTKSVVKKEHRWGRSYFRICWRLSITWQAKGYTQNLLTWHDFCFLIFPNGLLKHLERADVRLISANSTEWTISSQVGLKSLGENFPPDELESDMIEVQRVISRSNVWKQYPTSKARTRSAPAEMGEDVWRKKTIFHHTTTSPIRECSGA